MRLEIAPDLAIDDAELEISFIQSGGPGGQNVNKVATAAQLRFDVRQSLSLPNEVKVRLQALAGTRLTRDGVIVITARQHRTQDRNRQDAVARLVDLIRRASVRPIKRRATKPSFGERQRRLEAKTHRAGIKKARARPEKDD
ncbi:MAG: alternative ribosome rescue aminoacyl-tRNA hydrolase ArfB [Rhodospirillales bacterium]